MTDFAGISKRSPTSPRSPREASSSKNDVLPGPYQRGDQFLRLLSPRRKALYATPKITVFVDEEGKIEVRWPSDIGSVGSLERKMDTQKNIVTLHVLKPRP